MHVILTYQTRRSHHFNVVGDLKAPTIRAGGDRFPATSTPGTWEPERLTTQAGVAAPWRDLPQLMQRLHLLRPSERCG